MNKKKISALVMAGLLACTFMAGCGNTAGDNGGGSAKQEQKSPEMQAYENFLTIPMGASYDDVKKALGSDGNLTTENEIAGMKTQAYEWKEGSTAVTGLFQNGALITKAIVSPSVFKTNGETIKLAQFDKIQPGMTYEQAKETLNNREGYLLSEAEMMGTGAKVYIWMNDDQSSVQLTFTNGTVSGKAQSNLK